GRHFERLEDVDRREAERESALHRARAALAEVDADLSAGRRARALDALLRLKGQARMDPEMRRHVENLLADLEARRPRGRIALSLASARDALTVAADLPVRIGRAEDSILPLRDPGVSRHHARISVEAGRFVLEDLGSRNGTFVDGLLLGAPLTVEGALRIGLGERCEIEVAPLGVTGLLLRVEKGLSAGALALLLAGPVDLAELEGLDLDARLAERSGWFVLTPSGPARLEGRELPAGTSIEVLVDDRITVGEALFEVRRG
ncbi:MAG: FHA domain-containing protein, partial [Deltaproteobacteria bacterium]